MEEKGKRSLEVLAEELLQFTVPAGSSKKHLTVSLKGLQKEEVAHSHMPGYKTNGQ